MATNSLTLALFDLDGTLVDSQHSIISAMEAAWRSEGLAPPTAGQIRRVVGLALEQSIAVLAPKASQGQRARLVQAYRESFFAQHVAVAQASPLFAGAVAALDALDGEQVLLGIATGKSRRGLDRVLAGHGLTDRFVTLQTPDTAPGKPDPGMVLQAAAETGVALENIAVIGDTVFDVRMAKAAGASAVGVSWGYHSAEELTAAGADSLVAEFGDLLSAVLGLLRGDRRQPLAMPA